MQAHVDDHWVQRSRIEGWRSRAVYKLLEINQQVKLFRAGMRVADLGASPGGWSQYAVKQIQPHGKLLAVDQIEMQYLPGVDFIQGGLADQLVQEKIKQYLHGGCFDLVLSDMAPNLTGISATDQSRMLHLVELALDFCERFLSTGGDMLIKTFHGGDFNQARKVINNSFSKVSIKKPRASRDHSSECYILALSKL